MEGTLAGLAVVLRLPRVERAGLAALIWVEYRESEARPVVEVITRIA
jgi:hypothetical protein